MRHNPHVLLLVCGAVIGTVGGTVLGKIFRPSPTSRMRQLSVEDARKISASALTLTGSTTGAYLIEVIDYECPGCRQLENALDDNWKKLPAGTGRQIVVFSLPGHDGSLVASDFEIVAEDYGFGPEMHRFLMRSRDLSQSTLWKEALKHNVLRPALELSLAKVQRKSSSLKRRELCLRLGIQGTPTLLVRKNSGQIFVAESPNEALEALRVE